MTEPGPSGMDLNMSEYKYTLSDIIQCMRISATMLELADGGNDKNYLGQARLLRAAADDLEARNMYPDGAQP